MYHNIIELDQYRELKHRLESDPNFRKFVLALLEDLKVIGKDSQKARYTKITFNGEDVTDRVD
jgi:hypothetical protein